MARRPHLLLLVLLCLLAQPAAPDEPDLAARAKAVLAQTSGTLRLPGLQRPVTVLRDPWGVAHIFAETQDDLFFAQGFVAAQDRLWQMEIWRRTGEGRLAEVLGPEAVDRDRFARLLRYRGDLDAEYRSYAPDAKPILEAFVRGINAFIESSRDRLPIEFQLSGIRPEPWTPEACLSRMAAFGMTGNALREVTRARLGSVLGWKLADELVPSDPPVSLESQPRIGLEGIDEKLLTLPLAALAPLSFQEKARDGSNNWVVDGALSATGKPLLANDPHRALTVPSLRYLVHLVGPGWNVIGAGEPALPGVAAGHNDRVAFGFTIVGIDQQDLYVEETHPQNPDKVRVRRGWEPMKIERQRIAVKGGEPVEVVLKFTRHGPVIHEDLKRHRAYVLRWVGTEPGTAGYLASLSLNRARSWPEFRQALQRWKVPSENLVYADVDGNIGWQVAGLTPVRKGWSGLLPVPGAGGAYEWRGFLPTSELPSAFNPSQHYLATANHNILPPDYPHELGFDWGPPARFRSIDGVLGGAGERKFDVPDFQRLQYDEVSLPARSLVRLLGEVKGADGDLLPWVKKLVVWDGTIGRDSAAAALYEIWKAKLPAAIFKPFVPEKWLSVVAGGTERMVDLLRNPSPRWFGKDPRARRDAVLLKSLEEAMAEAKEKLGPDPETWRWGAIHTLALRHVLATGPERQALFGLPAVERGGDGDTLNVGVGTGFEVAHGASFREVLDVADWDRSVATNVPGQSGQPGSPHYGDLLPLWGEGRYFPLLFSREKIEAAAKERLVLEPEVSRADRP
ncbi:MAG TPA: penicillin acylase family protein [Thermoanaerobaculia bacterium]|jgi:penicillin amidase|nr:penicillin acylase family protein [Thermoanaerobaculia bacterium]